MPQTPIALYRQGNANSPRMDNVRPNKDIATFEEKNFIFVTTTLQDGTSPGGISTFATPGRGKNWWKLDPATDIPAQLKLVNDRENHWLWQPDEIMFLEDYKTALRQVGERLYRIS
ncbi:MAG: hypothetical protein RMY62_015945 [Nostoc sp. ZfuVER08]|jgi:hypothetical protein|uniref:Tse2 ADP-ribosyltransferase toxin domain-containing protein n=1 Tax=Nostoc punctiforme FACHB-252 TaxID=1357509 RepID=A0ABR8H9J3_NOSPU|nr:hypothetical protein [Nostoc punctiforme]MBD2612083.1 hypothetical protein [Nostoc punctiforme FACHB-252]MDZ8010277.1 hypothetical protein [Nostoc sp. ZfuVER08]